jgi:hypothetical protein
MLVGRALKNSHMVRQRPDGSHAIYRIYLQIRDLPYAKAERTEAQKHKVWLDSSDRAGYDADNMKTVFAISLAFLLQGASILARDLPFNHPTDVTGTISLEGRDDFFLTSKDTVKGDPIRHMAIWVGGDTGDRVKSILTAAANTGKPITLNGFFKEPRHSSKLVFCTPIEDIKGR